MLLQANLEENKKVIKNYLPIDKSFDVIGRDLILGNSIKAYLLFIDGFAKDEMLFWIIKSLQELSSEQITVNQLKEWIAKHISYIEVSSFEDLSEMQMNILSGAAAIILDGQTSGILLDIRTYPARSPEEPDLERVTRGARDGLVETIIFNTALIRRRLRDPKLICEITNVGKRSKTDVVLAYINDLVNQELLSDIKAKINSIQVDALIMGEKSLEELLFKKKWYNPLPQVRFTERPDVVTAHLLEGHIAIIVDTSPSVMLIPVTIFHFTQHSEDYYQNPLVGTYIRWIRFVSIFLALLLTPVWLVLVNNINDLPSFLSFIGPKDDYSISLFFQFLILEFGLDTLRIASIHTPNTLSTSLGIIGGLVLSQFAIDVGWFVPETVLYMAIVALGTFSCPSIEFALAIRIFRLFLLILTGLFNFWGLIAGLIIIIFIVLTTKSIGKIKYTWPLIPFNASALLHILFRLPIIQIKRNNK